VPLCETESTVRTILTLTQTVTVLNGGHALRPLHLPRLPFTDSIELAPMLIVHGGRQRIIEQLDLTMLLLIRETRCTLRVWLRSACDGRSDGQRGEADDRRSASCLVPVEYLSLALGRPDAEFYAVIEHVVFSGSGQSVGVDLSGRLQIGLQR